MPKGNPNPSPATRFGAGQRGNPQGKTGFQREKEIENAAIATEIRSQFLRALRLIVTGPTTPEEQAEHDLAFGRWKFISADTLRLLKDSEDRGLGTPKASVDISNDDGSLKQEPVRDLVLEALKTIHAKPDAG